jgi:4-hydroxy-3-methylbut-2-enyl diphosphate reductase
VAPDVDALIVVGAPNSSNSQRLREAALEAGCRTAVLIQRAADLDWALFKGVARVGVTAGASAPEVLVDEVVEAFRQRFDVTTSLVKTADEPIVFGLPRELRTA